MSVTLIKRWDKATAAAATAAHSSGCRKGWDGRKCCGLKGCTSFKGEPNAISFVKKSISHCWDNSWLQLNSDLICTRGSEEIAKCEIRFAAALRSCLDRIKCLWQLLKLPRVRPFFISVILFFAHFANFRFRRQAKQSNANTAHALAAAHSPPMPPFSVSLPLALSLSRPVSLSAYSGSAFSFPCAFCFYWHKNH